MIEFICDECRIPACTKCKCIPTCRSVRALRQHCRCVLRTLRQCCRTVLLPKCLATEVSVKRTTWWRRYESRRWRRTQPSSCVCVRYTTQPVRQVRRAVPCRQRNTSTASLNSIRSRTGNQWRSRSSGVICTWLSDVSWSYINVRSKAAS